MSNHLTKPSLSLNELGWRPFFQQQLASDEWEAFLPARVLEQHKSKLDLALDSELISHDITPSMPALTVGDWLLLDTNKQFVRVLERQSCFRRKAAGSKISEQLIASNVDTAFIVCSLNDDFNLNRIERYLALAHDAGAEPVVVLTKRDLCKEPERLIDSVRALDRSLCIESLNGLNREECYILFAWCQRGKTVVMLGSSGAGKSTLSNSLLGYELQATAGIRETDSKGRHTTTRRSLLAIPNGRLILDTPGMRELQIADCEDGLALTFADIESLTEQCRFSDCHHETEPGCEVINAIKVGNIDERRLVNYRKLLREQALNGASLAERRANDRKLSKLYKSVQKSGRKLKQT